MEKPCPGSLTPFSFHLYPSRRNDTNARSSLSLNLFKNYKIRHRYRNMTWNRCRAERRLQGKTLCCPPFRPEGGALLVCAPWAPLCVPHPIPSPPSPPRYPLSCRVPTTFATSSRHSSACPSVPCVLQTALGHGAQAEQAPGCMLPPGQSWRLIKCCAVARR